VPYEKTIEKLLHGSGLTGGVIFETYKQYLLSRSRLGSDETKFLRVINPDVFKGIRLDVGCGIVKYTETIEYHGISSIGIDIDVKFLSIAKDHKSRNTEHICGDANTLPFRNGFFKLVSAFDLIEHLSDTKKAILEMKRVLKSDGIMFFLVGNRMWYFEPHTMLPFMSFFPITCVDFVCKKLRPGFLKFFKSYKYINLPTYRELNNLLIEAGLSYSIWPRIGGYLIYPVISIPYIGLLEIKYYLETKRGRHLLSRYLAYRKQPSSILRITKILRTLLKTKIAKWICTSWIVVAKHSI